MIYGYFCLDQIQFRFLEHYFKHTQFHFGFNFLRIELLGSVQRSDNNYSLVIPNFFTCLSIMRLGSSLNVAPAVSLMVDSCRQYGYYRVILT